MREMILILAVLTAGMCLVSCEGFSFVVEEHPHSYEHFDGCGHYYWHASWHGSPHPSECVRCYHRHDYGCGHYYWHGRWYSRRHRIDCGWCF